MGKPNANRKGTKPNEKSKKKKGADQSVKSFPMEKGPQPSKLLPTEITWLYKVPDSKFRTDADVVAHHGYKLEEKLDAGSYGVIFIARDKKNQKLACKMMELGSSWTDSRVVDMKNELFIMDKVKHLYIIQVYTHFLTLADGGNRLFIFMELADGGNFAKFLSKRLPEKGVLTEKEAKLYYAQIVCGISHIHSLGIAHRDIKLQNILMAKNEKSISGDFTLLIADFGLSRIIHHENDGAIESNRTFCGTPLFMAPEILSHQPYNSFIVDMWALGVTIFIMLTNGVPFDFRDQSKAIKDMYDKKWCWPTSKMKAAPSAELKSLTSSLLEPEPSKRLTISNTCTHKWLASEFKKAQVLANKSKCR